MKAHNHSMSTFYIKCQSFEKANVHACIKHIVCIARFLHLDCVAFAFPRKQKKLTVCRSPHIDKKSREQFAMNTYRSVMLVQTQSHSAQLLLMYLLKHFPFQGIQLSIAVKYTTFYTYQCSQTTTVLHT